MNSTEPIRAPETAQRPTVGDEVTEFLPWFAPIPVLVPIALLSLMLWAPFLLLFALALAVAAVIGVVAAAGAILAAPYLLIRHRRQHTAERRRSPERSIAIPGAIARVGGAQ
jgi:hypothetical protein